MEISVNNMTYGIELVDNNSNELLMSDGGHHFGVTNYKKRMIYIMNDLREDIFYSVLRHELVHVYIECYGMFQINWEEEVVCDFVAAHLVNINKDLQKIREEMKKARNNDE